MNTLQFNELMSNIDVLIILSFSNQLLITNLTGHPCMVIPNGSYADENQVHYLLSHFDEKCLSCTISTKITPYNKEYPDLLNPSHFMLGITILFKINFLFLFNFMLMQVKYLLNFTDLFIKTRNKV